MLKFFPCASQGLNFGLWTKENLGSIKLRRNILQQFENVKIYKKTVCDWMARVNLQILLTLAALAITTFEIVLF